MTQQVGALAELEEVFSRRTTSRRAVLQAVASWPGLFSAEDLCQVLPTVGRATVYRALASLLQAGLLCRVLDEHGAPRYQLGGTRHHHHLVCVECGRLEDIADCGVDDFVGSVADRFGYVPVTHRLEIYGRCAGCSREAV